MNCFDWRNWRLVLKLDPEKKFPKAFFSVIKEMKFKDFDVDAVVIGGTQGITYFNTFNLWQQVKRAGYKGPLLQEISRPQVVIPGFDGYLIPMVLNTNNKYWLMDAHLKAIEKYGKFINWDNILVESYLICNQNSAAAKLTDSISVTADDAVNYLILAQKIFQLPTFYIEYSGKFGDLNLVKKVAGNRQNIHLIYGGGIKEGSQIKELLKYVDTVVVGNSLYDE